MEQPSPLSPPSSVIQLQGQCLLRSPCPQSFGSPAMGASPWLTSPELPLESQTKKCPLSGPFTPPLCAPNKIWWTTPPGPPREIFLEHPGFSPPLQSFSPIPPCLDCPIPCQKTLSLFDWPPPGRPPPLVVLLFRALLFLPHPHPSLPFGKQFC